MAPSRRKTPAQFAPTRTSFMDEAMQALWNRMTAMPADLRLYGGTALALYLDHRASTDFGFATPSPAVDTTLARTIPWLAGAHLHGGAGMVDATVEAGRPVRITLMETGAMIPHPTRPAIHAPNGVRVAHPEDLIRAKLEACLTRDAPRDFIDIAHAARNWPELTRTAIARYIENSTRSRAAVTRELVNPPAAADAALPPPDRTTLRELATTLATQAPHRTGPGRRTTGWER